MRLWWLTLCIKYSHSKGRKMNKVVQILRWMWKGLIMILEAIFRSLTKTQVMRNPKDKYFAMFVISLFVKVASCVYYYIDSEGCAYCEEVNLHFIAGPMCDGDAADKRTWIDSMQIQGNRNGQNWLCEIR